MNISTYTRMNYQELSEEIEKTKKKIKTLQEQIRLLEKLQIAERAKNNNGGMNNVVHDNQKR
ncbi:MAG: hypothetical protein IJH92_08670 [Mogibacterium sp.]|nr:hypothetical protein [Mogibacterium sp.]